MNKTDISIGSKKKADLDYHKLNDHVQQSPPQEKIKRIVHLMIICTLSTIRLKETLNVCPRKRNSNKYTKVLAKSKKIYRYHSYLWN